MRHTPVYLLILCFVLAGCASAPPTSTPGAGAPLPATVSDSTPSPLAAPVVTATETVTMVTAPITSPLAVPQITTTMPGSGEAGDCNWTAVHDFQPPGPPALHVTGVCIMPTPGYTLTLRRAEPQGFNPKILLLTLTAEPPAEIVAQVLTLAEVVYEETTDQHYDQVSILVEGNMPHSANVDVKEVQ
jgi:hypothetical protein